MLKLVWGAGGVITLYMFIPWLISRGFGWGVLKKGIGPYTALTFDDGPHPEYTPMLLDLLKEHGIKATFFVLGHNAKKHPAIIQRIHAEGHCLGIHNYTHHSNWIMLPVTIANKHIKRTADTIEEMVGVRPTYYRPPWGIMNVFDLFWHRSYRIVLWSAMLGDWFRFEDGDEIKLQNRLRRSIRDGNIVLMHDSGETPGADKRAPFYMLKALSQVLMEYQHDSSRFVRIDELDTIAASSPLKKVSWLKRIIVSSWFAWDRLFARIFGIVPVDQDQTFLKLRIRSYSGNDPLPLTDGTKIERGDQIAELHVDNEMLFRMGIESKSTIQLTVMIIRAMEKLLPVIAQLFETDPKYNEVKGLYGISLLHRGVRSFGFSVIELPRGILFTITKWYLRILMVVIHPQGKTRLRTKREQLVPKIIAISKQDIINRYLADTKS